MPQRTELEGNINAKGSRPDNILDFIWNKYLKQKEIVLVVS